MIPEVYWDLEVPRWSKAAAERILTALVEVEGVITCTFPHRYGPGGKTASVDFRIKLPIGFQPRFEELSGYVLRTPARVEVMSLDVEGS